LLLLFAVAAGSAVVRRGQRSVAGVAVAQGDVGDGGSGAGPATAAVPAHTRVYTPQPIAVDAGKVDGLAKAAKTTALPPEDIYISIGINDGGRPDLGTCRHDSDCKVHEACAIDRGSRRFACLRSDCASDEDCEGDMQCRMVGDDLAVARCVKGGRRYAGERCSANPFDANQACQLGLFCNAGHCGTACDKASPASCRAGDECADSADGPVCTPKSCKSIGCPGGEQCVSISARESVCVRATAGEDCFAHPCARGEGCIVSPGMRQTLAYQCAKWCNPLDATTCGAGEVCGQGGSGSVCYRACVNPNDCSKGQACQTVSEDLQMTGCVVSAD
jgi:hypothetical protein